MTKVCAQLCFTFTFFTFFHFFAFFFEGSSNIKKRNGFLPVIADCQLADDKSLCTALLHFHLITFICQLCVHNPCTDYDKKLLGMLLHFLSDIESFAAIRKTSPRITFSWISSNWKTSHFAATLLVPNRGKRMSTNSPVNRSCYPWEDFVETEVLLHSALEGVKTPKKMTGAGVKCIMCINTIPITTRNLKIGQRRNPDIWPILSFFTYYMGRWVGAPT